MNTTHLGSSRRVLEPIDRISEVLFGLIMALTFTGSLSVAAGRPEVRVMLVGAIGCNLAWALIDAIMYLMGCLVDRAADRQTMTRVLRAATPEEARATIAARLPSLLAPALTAADLDRVHFTLSRSPISASQAKLESEDWLGAAAVFILVFGSTLPIVIPFLLLQDAHTALRVSNSIAVLMMLIAGYAFGHLVGYRPWWTAASMVMLGCLLVALTIALGG
jgi:VIT family